MARTNDDPGVLRLEPHDEQRLAGRNAEPLALADREVDDALVPADHAAIDMHDITRHSCLRAQLGDHVGIAAAGDEADVLAVGLGGDRETEFLGQSAHLRLCQAAEREVQPRQLVRRGRKQKVALVACSIRRPVQRWAGRTLTPLDVVAGDEPIGAKIARRGQQIVELHFLVARHTGNWRLAAHVAVRERIDHGGAEPAFVVENVVRNPQMLRRTTGIVDILARAARAGAPRGSTMVVELQGDADHLVAFAHHQSRRDRAVDAARHCNDDPPARACGAGLGVALW